MQQPDFSFANNLKIQSTAIHTIRSKKNGTQRERERESARSGNDGKQTKPLFMPQLLLLDIVTIIIII